MKAPASHHQCVDAPFASESHGLIVESAFEIRRGVGCVNHPLACQPRHIRQGEWIAG